MAEGGGDPVTKYCCARHALCNVGIPDPDGAHARTEYARLHQVGPEDCGRRSGYHGAVIYGRTDPEPSQAAIEKAEAIVSQLLDGKP